MSPTNGDETHAVEQDLMGKEDKSALRNRVIAISLSFLIGLGLMLLKFYVYWLTQSSAILSDALESIINVVASAFAFWSILLAAKPPDRSHPYGHGKIEYFSAGFEGALIIIAAVGIVREAIPQILNPHDLPNLESGLWLLLLTSLINLALGIGLVRVGKRTKSLVLVADGRHVLTDVYTSGGVLLGLLLVHKTGLHWLDGVIAVAVALNILVVGTRLVRESFAGLMDASDPELLDQITTLIQNHRKAAWIDIHRLRAWRSGNCAYVDFHLILPRDLTLEQAHLEVEEVGALFRTHLMGIGDVLVHAEPCIAPECPICGHDPCALRQSPTEKQSPWHQESLISQPGDQQPTDSIEDQRHKCADE